jgi:hypothetical protein
VRATLVGEVIPLSVRSGCPHILCLSHKTLGNAPETCCRARTMMQQMTGRGYLYGAMSECPIIAGNARAMAKVGVVSNAKTMTEATLPHQCLIRNRPPQHWIGTVAGT